MLDFPQHPDVYFSVADMMQKSAKEELNSLPEKPKEIDIRRYSTVKTNSLHRKFPTIDEYRQGQLFTIPVEETTSEAAVLEAGTVVTITDPHLVQVWTEMARQNPKVFEYAVIVTDKYNRVTRDLPTFTLAARKDMSPEELKKFMYQLSSGSLKDLVALRDATTGYIYDKLLRELCRNNKDVKLEDFAK